MTTIQKRFSPNVAQLRNIKNWLPAERPFKTWKVIQPAPPGMDVGDVREAVESLVRRHEALRSRLGHDASGAPVQEVISAETADQCIEWRLVDRTAAGDIDDVVLRSLRAEPVDPATAALRCSLHLYRRQVLVLLSISHMFADGVAIQTVAHDLALLLDRAVLPPVPERSQASAFAAETMAAQVADNTEFWEQTLTGETRACTYSGGRRPGEESVRKVKLALAGDLREAFRHAASSMLVTPNALWAACMSVLVGRLTGQHSHVFRLAAANRFHPLDLAAVTQLAAPLYLPVHGHPDETPAERASRVFKVMIDSMPRGLYDVTSLLDRLDDPAVRMGAAFQPAFEFGYMPSLHGGRDDYDEQLEDWREYEETVRVDPNMAKSDVILYVSEPPGSTTVTLYTRPQVWRQRSPGELLNDLLTVADHVCRKSGEAISDIPAQPLPSVTRLLRGHRSGVAIDVPANRMLVKESPGVFDCQLTLDDASNGHQRLIARVIASSEVTARQLTTECTARQPWFSGTVVPDEFQIATR